MRFFLVALIWLLVVFVILASYGDIYERYRSLFNAVFTFAIVVFTVKLLLRLRIIDVSGHPIVVGGGIKNSEELDKLEDLGAAGVVLSTAIHEAYPGRSRTIGDRTTLTKADDLEAALPPTAMLQNREVPVDLVL